MDIIGINLCSLLACVLTIVLLKAPAVSAKIESSVEDQDCED